MTYRRHAVSSSFGVQRDLLKTKICTSFFDALAHFLVQSEALLQ